MGLFILPCSAAPAVTPGRAGPGLSLADPLDDVELLKAGARDVRFTAKAAIAYSINSSARASSEKTLDQRQPRFFMVIPDRFTLNKRFKFTARISTTIPFAFSSCTIFERLIVADCASTAV